MLVLCIFPLLPLLATPKDDLILDFLLLSGKIYGTEEDTAEEDEEEIADGVWDNEGYANY